MLNLYWKIFFGFWLTGVVLGGGALFVNQQLRLDVSPELQGLSPNEIVNRTSFILRRLPGETASWQEELRERDVELYLQPAENRSLSQQNLPAEILLLFNKLETQQRVEQSSFTRLIVGMNESDANGKAVRFVMSMPGINVYRAKQFAKQLTVQLVLALSLSGIACLILARYLTHNLKVLSSAAKSLAAGDLSTRARTQKRIFYDELTLLAEDFNHMAESLEASVETQRRLVRDISHELRSPIARLQIALELARNSDSHQQLDRIELEAERLNELINQILAMPEATHAREEQIDLSQLTKAVLDSNKIEAENKGVSLRLNPATGDTNITGKPAQLTSAIENIVRNAIHYTDENSKVLVTITGDYHRVKLNIRDHGSGVPPQDLAHIFEPFYRVDPARNRKTGGYGVGLAIVKRTIEAHGGTVKARNCSPGLEVLVELPRDTTSVTKDQKKH